jgi:hypothetical protein
MMRRVITIVSHVTAGISLALCLATAIAWERGGWTDNQFHRLAGHWEYTTDGGSMPGVIQLVFVHWWRAPIVGPPADVRGPAIDSWINKPFHFRFESGGFGVHFWVELGSNNATNWGMPGRRLDLKAPFAGAIAVLLIPPFFVWVLLPMRRRGINAIRQSAEARIENTPVTTDLTCVHCGYNLRTLSSMSRCPECGLPVNESLSPSADLATSRPAWLKRMVAGNVLLFLAKGFLLAAFVTVFQRNGGFVEEYPPALGCSGAFIVLYAAGIFFVTTGKYPRMPPSSRVSEIRLRKLAAASLLCLTAGVCYQAIRTITAPRPKGLMGAVSVEWYWPSLLLLLIGWIFYCICVTFESRLLSRLASRLGDPVLTRLCIWVGSITAASGLALIYGAERIVMQWMELGIFTVVIILWIVSLICAGLINLDVATRLRARQSRAKRYPNPNAGPVTLDDHHGALDSARPG